MEIRELKEKIRKLADKKYEIYARVKRENREETGEEFATIEELDAAIASLSKELPERRLTSKAPAAGEVMGHFPPSGIN